MAPKLNKNFAERVLAFLILLSIFIGSLLIYLKVAQDYEICKEWIVAVFGFGIGLPLILLGCFASADHSPDVDPDIDLDV